ncbi:unnamed protein product [Phaedon cochleariae]|uniref:Ubiquitin carboxyl-terminal hydrolase n=1 Tax=Phaedon cochleariae TaxID=80249 RepID=A0A9N9SAR9_PHACE|nr:unnamed protein product [Phaedon cochleariae]
MPVLSPHRSSASGLSGSYRSAFNSSALDRPFFGSSYHPRTSSYSERYISRSYTDSTGRRIYSRSGSVTEDGITTSRFREDSREPSLSRDSSIIGSIRENSVSDYSSARRESSLTRGDHRTKVVDVIDSVAELRNKYSPANYVPACLRRNENVTRSKSINDIGLPPIESKTTKKKVTDRVESVYANNSVSHPNNTNTDSNSNDEDYNGNRESVANLCKKFDERLSKSPENNKIIIDVKFKASESPVGVKVSNGKAVKKSSNTVSTSKHKSNSKLEVNGEGNHANGTEIDREELSSGAAPSRSNSRVNDFASYISTRDLQKGDENNSESQDNNSKNDMDNKDSYVGKSTQLNDVSTSPKRNRSVVSPSGSSLTNNSISSSFQQRRSSDRDRDGYNRASGGREYSDDDSGGERNNYTYNATVRSSPVKVLGLNGLKNIGNTCFMNSVIQCLSHTRWLLEYLRKDAYIRDINTTISSMKGALIKAFAAVIQELWSEDSSDRVVNTVSLKSQIQRFAPRFIGYAQQDAQEFLRYLLEGLHEDVNRVVEKPKPILTEIDEKLSDNEKALESWSRYLRMDNSKIVDHFVGQLKSTLRCTLCGHCSVTFDPFWDLSLPIPQRTGPLRLAQCLDSFTREETLDGEEKPTCSKCKERRKCTKSLSIHKFPKVLVIHLKRFSPTERFRGKLNVTVDFPLDGLDMSSYAADGHAPCRYNLYAISNHSGTTYSGHYTAYCRHPYSNNWHEYNDSRVSSISPKSLVSGEAYVLFYQQEGSKSHL